MADWKKMAKDALLTAGKTAINGGVTTAVGFAFNGIKQYKNQKTNESTPGTTEFEAKKAKQEAQQAETQKKILAEQEAVKFKIQNLQDQGFSPEEIREKLKSPIEKLSQLTGKSIQIVCETLWKHTPFTESNAVRKDELAEKRHQRTMRAIQREEELKQAKKKK